MSGDLPLAINQLQLALAVPEPDRRAARALRRASARAAREPAEGAREARESREQAAGRSPERVEPGLVESAAASQLLTEFRCSSLTPGACDRAGRPRGPVVRAGCASTTVAYAGDPIEPREPRRLQVQRRARPRRPEADREGLRQGHARLAARPASAISSTNLVLPRHDRQPAAAGQAQGRRGRTRRASWSTRRWVSAASLTSRRALDLPQHDEDLGQTLGRVGRAAGSLPDAAVPRAVDGARRAVARRRQRVRRR